MEQTEHERRRKKAKKVINVRREPVERVKIALDRFVKEKGMKEDDVIETMKNAILETARRLYPGGILEVRYDKDDEREGFKLYRTRTVVETVSDPATQISLSEAVKTYGMVEVGDDIEEEYPIRDLGRIGSSLAKSIMTGMLEEKESQIIYEAFKNKEGSLVSGRVRRVERGIVYVSIRDYSEKRIDREVEAELPYQEKIPDERLNRDDIVKAVIKEVKKVTRRNVTQTRIILSRAAPEFVRELFKSEVPEIAQGIVEIKSVAREPGVRTKIAVHSSEPDTDPVGACVGIRGNRVQNIVQELKGERIDIVLWSDDIGKFIINALAPAVVRVMTIDKVRNTVIAVVLDEHLAAAIGKRGVNVKLASELVRWRIQVRSEREMEDLKRKAVEAFSEIPDIGAKVSQMLISAGYESVESIAKATLQEIESVPGLTKTEAKYVWEQAIKIVEQKKKGQEQQQQKQESLPVSESVPEPAHSTEIEGRERGREKEKEKEKEKGGGGGGEEEEKENESKDTTVQEG